MIQSKNGRPYMPFSEVAKQFCRADVQRLGDLEHDGEGGDAVAAFDEADVGAADAGAFRELVLREAALLAPAADDLAESDGFRTFVFLRRHSCILTMLNLYCPITIFMLLHRR